MKNTIVLDKAGRVVIPKGIRDQLNLTEGSELQLEVVGDRIELRHKADEVSFERRGKLRVIMAGEPFDAGQAVLEDRKDRLKQVGTRSRKGT